MSVETNEPEQQLPLVGAGQQLRDAREQAGMTIEQVAKETRIPIRHLELIEAGDFEHLPARTYAIGFSRTYARVVGLDERMIADRVREELGESRYHEAHRATKFQPGDPARVPSRGLAWFSGFAAILLIAGGFAFFRPYFFSGSGPGPITAAPTAPEGVAQAGRVDGNQRAASAAVPAGPIVFTALEDGLWVRFYDGSGERLLEKELAQGERYTVPADADNPQLWTGQPESLAVSIGGQRLGNLSLESEILRDIPLNAQSLVERIRGRGADTGADTGANNGANTDTDGNTGNRAGTGDTSNNPSSERVDVRDTAR